MAKTKRKRPPQAQVDLAHQVVGIIQQEYSGPIPPPDALEKYNRIIPNGADRIMTMAEEQSKHRRELEKTALNSDSRNSFLGILSALTIGLGTIVTGGIIISKGHAWPGTILGSAGLVGLVSVFIYGTQQRRSERQAKAAMMH